MQKAKKSKIKQILVVKFTLFWCRHFKIAITSLVSSFMFPSNSETENLSKFSVSDRYFRLLLAKKTPNLAAF